MAKMIEVKNSVADAVSYAFGIIEELAGEMREAFDNTPESLQNSGVGERRGEAADNLENISEVDVPEKLQDEKYQVTFFELPWGKRGLSRAKRMSNALSAMDAVIQYLDDIINETKDNQDLVDDAESLRDDLDNAKNDAEAVEFPGMFG